MVGAAVRASSHNGLQRIITFALGLSTSIIPGFLTTGHIAIALIAISLLGLGAATLFARRGGSLCFGLGLSASVMLALLTTGQAATATLTVVLAIAALIYFRQRGARQANSVGNSQNFPLLKVEEHRRAVWFISGLLGSIALGEVLASQRAVATVITIVIGLGALTYFRREQNLQAEGLAAAEQRSAFQRTEHLAAQQASDLLATHCTLEDIRCLSGEDFEKHVAAFYGRQGYKTERNGGPGDQGLDVLATNEVERIAIQCKRHEANVGNGAVQEALGALFYHGCSRAMVIASSDFTTSAVALAKTTGIELVNGVEYIDRVRRLGPS